MAHWTEENIDAFAHRVAFDFIAQMESRMEASSITQAQLARKLGVSEGAVSKVLNNPQNLTVKTMVKYARALSMKPAIVAYDDADANNERGPISSSVFTTCWERAGKPHDLWSLQPSVVYGSAAKNFINWAEWSVLASNENRSHATFSCRGLSNRLIQWFPSQPRGSSQDENILAVAATTFPVTMIAGADVHG